MEEMYARWVIAGGLALSAWLLGWIIRKFLFGRLASFFAKTESDLDDLIFQAVRPHVPIWFLLLGIEAGSRIAPMPEKDLLLLDKSMTAILILSITIVASRVAVHLVNHLSARHGAEIPTTGVTLGILRGIILILGGLMVLSSWGVSIGPILGALGIGSLAVALALQPTLSNLFAGALISATKRVRLGDYIELDQGPAGYVVDVGWRSTHIRDRENNLVFIPNAKLIDSIVRNWMLPDEEVGVLVASAASYGSDLAKVERVALDVARSVLNEVPGGVPTFEPSIRFNSFGDSAITFTVMLRVRRFDDRPFLTHEFIKRLHARFQSEGIEIPFPQRDLHVRTQVPTHVPM